MNERIIIFNLLPCTSTEFTRKISSFDIEKQKLLNYELKKMVEEGLVEMQVDGEVRYELTQKGKEVWYKEQTKTEAISFEGLKKLRKLNPLPRNWYDLLKRYIEHKRRMILVKRKRNLDTIDDEIMLMRAIEIFEEIKRDVAYGRRQIS
jgi:hypothetical protein